MLLIDLKKMKVTISLLLAICCFTVLANHPLDNPEKDNFRFFINADPQMGPESTGNKGLKILNELLQMFVEEVNDENQESPIDFVVYNGDLVWHPHQDAFDNFAKIVKNQEVPTVLVHGNHDGHNDDPKFLQAQQILSGYQKLNYSFDYGQWHMVVMAAREKYLTKSLQKQQLAWLKKELDEHKDQKIMLFMHYHIMPTGLSQMEYYSYKTVTFKNAILDSITEHGNVKYVFTGHVHSGVKASIKSSVEYNGTKFINVPTPVRARPFGEEYAAYETDPDNLYFRRGFYLEVVVDGEDVQLIGRKINHDHKVTYPQKFNTFTKDMDPRFFKPESLTEPNSVIINPSFDDGLKGWQTSFRYKKDSNPAFNNYVRNGQNILRLNAPWGSWTFDEYMETYQVVELDLSKPNRLAYVFEKPTYSKNGAGGFFKLSFFNSQNNLEEMVILHWGHKQERVKFTYQSWFYNTTGVRGAAVDYKELIDNNNLLSMPLKFDNNKQQVLELDINNLLLAMNQPIYQSKINKMTVSHGVWTRILMRESKIKSILKVASVFVYDDSYSHLKRFQQYIVNNNPLKLTAMLNQYYLQPIFNQDIKIVSILKQSIDSVLDGLSLQQQKAHQSNKLILLNNKEIPLSSKDTTIPYFDITKIRRP